MPFVALGRIGRALDSLKRFHAFYGITFLSMKESGVAVGKPIVWGSSQEGELLRKFYTPPGALPTKPYLIPFGKADSQYGYWRHEKYSAGTLQRARTTDNFAAAFEHPSREAWAFAPNYLDVLEGQLPKNDKGRPVRIPVLDLAAWLYRDRDIPKDLSSLVSTFRAEFGFADDKEFRRIFDDNIAAEPLEQFYSLDAVDRSELIALLRGVPEAPGLGGRSEQDVVAFIEQDIAERARLTLPDGFARNFHYTLKAQRFVVLAGRPGTGKTAFARAYAGALERLFPGGVNEVVVSVGQDYTESDVLGYEKLAGGLAATDLSRQLFLQDRPRDVYVVVLDEMNLAQVDYYLARLLPAIESDAEIELPGMDRRHVLPPDAYFIGTVNSFLEEPTRVPLSGPVKRRANIIEMPNPLTALLASGDRASFKTVVQSLLVQTLERCRARKDTGLTSVFDAFRTSALERAVGATSPVLQADCLSLLWDICTVCAEHPQTSLTFGVLQDIADYIGLAGWETFLIALDYQIAQKLVPQLSGPSSVAKNLLGKLAAHPSGFPFPQGQRALRALLETEDPTSSVVAYRF